MVLGVGCVVGDWVVDVVVMIIFVSFGVEGIFVVVVGKLVVVFVVVFVDLIVVVVVGLRFVRICVVVGVVVVDVIWFVVVVKLEVEEVVFGVLICCVCVVVFLFGVE